MKDNLSIIEHLKRASTPEAVLEVFGKAVGEVGADHFGAIFVPRPEERIEDVLLASRVPPAWLALYSSENFLRRDPAVRHCRRTVMPFDWESAPYNRESEPRVAEVVERARDFNMHKGIAVPIPSPNGIVGVVGIVGPHFDDRNAHVPMLHSLALHMFHRLEQLVGRTTRRVSDLTGRERDVLAWAAEGKTAWEIGCILNLSQRTIEWHMARACKKLGAKNRVQAIALSGTIRDAIIAA